MASKTHGLGPLEEWVKDRRLLTMALTHSSFANEREGLKEGGPAAGYGIHNERLEFLGDAVLQLVITEVLFQQYPDWDEGRLTQARSAIVCEPTLAEAARRMGLGQYLRLGRGEERTGGRGKPSILADALEAVIGAAYLSGGMARTREFIRSCLAFAWDPEVLAQAGRDFKTEFAERMRSRGEEVRYQLLNAVGPDHAKMFEVGLFVRDVLYAQAVGHSKKEAEQASARSALQRLAEEANTANDGED